MSDAQFRVYAVSEKLKMQIAAKRLATGMANEWLIAKAVQEKLPAIVRGLEDLGFGPAEVTGKVRWPMQDLESLREASGKVNIPASTLLLLCLKQFCEAEPEAPVKPKRTRKAKEVAPVVKKTTRSRRTKIKA